MSRTRQKEIYLNNNLASKPNVECINIWQNSCAEYWKDLSTPNENIQKNYSHYCESINKIRKIFHIDKNWEVAVFQNFTEAWFPFATALFQNQVQQCGKNHIVCCHKEMTNFFSNPLLAENFLLRHSNIIDLHTLLSLRTALVSQPFACPHSGLLSQNLFQECQKIEAIYHLDLSLAVGKYPINFDEIEADIITINGSLVHAPQNALLVVYRKECFPTLSIDQKNLSLSSADALVLALDHAQKNCDFTAMETARLKSILIQEVIQKLQDVYAIDVQEQLPNSCCLVFPKFHKELFLWALNRQNVFACVSDDNDGISFSLSALTTDRDIEEAVSRIIYVYNQYQQLWD